VPKARLELAWAVARHPLKMVCLPVPPLRQLSILFNIELVDNQIISLLAPALSEQVPMVYSLALSEQVLLVAPEQALLLVSPEPDLME